MICLWTDSESWTGSAHPSQALARYRGLVAPEARVIYVTLEANELSQIDPNDSNSFDYAGFDPSIPKAIQEIALGGV